MPRLGFSSPVLKAQQKEKSKQHVRDINMLNELEDYIDHMNDWENNFITDISTKVLKNDMLLSDKEREKLVQIYDKLMR